VTAMVIRYLQTNDPDMLSGGTAEGRAQHAG